MSVFHSVYGLHLSANRLIPGAGIPEGQPVCDVYDVEIVFGPIPAWLEHSLAASRTPRYVASNTHSTGNPTLVVSEFDSGAYFEFRYQDDTRFILDRQGTRIWASWQDPLTLEDTATYLLGPVLGFVLRLRGVTSLHASAIAIQDRALVLLGSAGSGKSTTAAALAVRGYPVISEDVCALYSSKGTFLVPPGYPCLRLWPDSVDTLFGRSDALPLLTPNWDKRFLDLSLREGAFQPTSLPLGAIYLLGERSDRVDAPYVDDIPARDKLTTLVANTYVNYLLDTKMRANEFVDLSRVLSSVPLRHVTPHTEPSELSKLCDVILSDFRASTGSDYNKPDAWDCTTNV